MHRIQGKRSHLIIPASMYDYELFMPNHSHISSGNRLFSLYFCLYNINWWVAELDNKHFAIQLAWSCFSTIQVDALFSNIRVIFLNIFLIVDTINFPSMKERESFMFSETFFEQIRHLTNRKLIPKPTLYLKGRKFIHKMAVFIQTSRYNQILSKNTLIVVCSWSHFSLVKFGTGVCFIWDV